MAHVVVSESPEIKYEDKYEDTQALKGGATLILPVNVKGTPSPTVTWYKGEDVLEASDTVNIETKDNSSRLTVKNVEAKDADLYKVTAENVAGSDSAEFTVTVKGTINT